jgi:hypothetical protein
MRTEAYQFEIFSVRLTVDQDKVRTDVTISIVLPFTDKRVVNVAYRKRGIGYEKFESLPKQIIELLAQDAGFFTSIIPLESAGVFNRPH